MEEMRLLTGNIQELILQKIIDEFGDNMEKEFIVTVRTRDRAGNIQSPYSTTTFVFDNKEPEITNLAPVSNSLINSSNIAMRLSEPLFNASAVSWYKQIVNFGIAPQANNYNFLDNTLLTWGGVDLNETTVTQTWSGLPLTDDPFMDIYYKYDLVIYDLAGNQKSLSTDFTHTNLLIDKTPPLINSVTLLQGADNTISGDTNRTLTHRTEKVVDMNNPGNTNYIELNSQNILPENIVQVRGQAGDKPNDLVVRVEPIEKNLDTSILPEIKIGFGSPETSATFASIQWIATTYDLNTSAGVTQTSGIFKNALTFNGTDGYAQISTYEHMDTSANDDFSASLWIKPERLTGTQTLFKKGAFYIELINNSIRAGYEANSLTATSKYIPKDEWTNVIITYDKSATLIKIYIDGVSITEMNLTTGPNSEQILIGNDSISGVTPYEGSVDEIFFYKKALSQAEITNLADQNLRELDFDELISGFFLDDFNLNSSANIIQGNAFFGIYTITDDPDYNGEAKIIVTGMTDYAGNEMNPRNGNKPETTLTSGDIQIGDLPLLITQDSFFAENGGYLKIGAEIFKYYPTTQLNQAQIESRALFGTAQAAHVNGAVVIFIDRDFIAKFKIDNIAPTISTPTYENLDANRYYKNNNVLNLRTTWDINDASNPYAYPNILMDLSALDSNENSFSLSPNSISIGTTQTSYEFQHTISSENSTPDKYKIDLPVKVIDRAGNMTIDNDYNVTLDNTSPFVESINIFDANGDLVISSLNTTRKPLSSGTYILNTTFSEEITDESGVNYASLDNNPLEFTISMPDGSTISSIQIDNLTTTSGTPGQLDADGYPINEGTQALSGTFTIPNSTNINDGQAQFNFSAYDIASNLGKEIFNNQWFEIDNTSPIVPNDLITYPAPTSANTTFINEEKHVITWNESLATDPASMHLGFGNSYMELVQSSVVSINSSDGITFKSSDFTLEAFIKPALASQGLNRIIISKQAGTDASGFSFGLTTSNKLFLKINNSLFTDINSTEIKPGIWTHVSATYNHKKQEVKLYKNGYQIAKTFKATNNVPLTPIENTKNIQIGAFSFNNTSNFIGGIDEVRLYSALKTGLMIRESMALRLDDSSSLFDKLKAYYRFEDANFLAQINDYSGNNLHIQNTTNVAKVAHPNKDNREIFWKENYAIGNHALELNGKSGYLQITDDDTLDIANSDFSIDFYLFNTGDNGTIIDKKENDNGYRVSIVNNEIKLNIHGVTRITLPAIPKHQWNHISLTVGYNLEAGMNEDVKAYLNGELIERNNSAGFDPVSNNEDLTIGKTWNNNSYFSGMIDNLRLWNKTLTIEEINEVMARKVAPGETLYTNISLSLPMEQISSGQILDDSSNSNHATIHNAWLLEKEGQYNRKHQTSRVEYSLQDAGYTAITPEFGYALNLEKGTVDGSIAGDYLKLPATNKIIGNTIGDLSLSAWFKTDSTQNLAIPHEGRIITLQTNNQGSLLSLFVTHTSVGIMYHNGTTVQPLTSNVNYKDNDWHLVTATYDHSESKLILYYDGLKVAEATTELANSIGSQNAYIGAKLAQNGTNENNKFDGQLDNIAIFTKTLTPVEVNSLLRKSIDATDTELQAYYQFDDIRIAADSSSNKWHGEIHGGALTGAMHFADLSSVITNATDSNIKVTVLDQAGGINADTLDYPIVIDTHDPEITITTQQTTSYYKGNSQITISWNSKNNQGALEEQNKETVDIVYSLDNGATFSSTIIENTSDNGTYTWILPANGINASSVVVRVTATDKAKNTYNEFSTIAQNFDSRDDTKEDIYIDMTPPVINPVIRPTGGEYWKSPSEAIEWFATDNMGLVTPETTYSPQIGHPIVIHFHNNEAWNQLPGDPKIPNSSPYDWLIANNLNIPKSKIKIQATDKSGNITSIESNEFTVDNSIPQVNSIESYDLDSDGKIDQLLVTVLDSPTGNDNKDNQILFNTITPQNFSNTYTFGDKNTTYLGESVIHGSGTHGSSFLINIAENLGTSAKKITTLDTAFTDRAGNPVALTENTDTIDKAGPALVYAKTYGEDTVLYSASEQMTLLSGVSSLSLTLGGTGRTITSITNPENFIIELDTALSQTLGIGNQSTSSEENSIHVIGDVTPAITCPDDTIQITVYNSTHPSGHTTTISNVEDWCDNTNISTNLLAQLLETELNKDTALSAKFIVRYDSPLNEFIISSAGLIKVSNPWVGATDINGFLEFTNVGSAQDEESNLNTQNFAIAVHDGLPPRPVSIKVYTNSSLTTEVKRDDSLVPTINNAGGNKTYYIKVEATENLFNSAIDNTLKIKIGATGYEETIFTGSRNSSNHSEFIFPWTVTETTGTVETSFEILLTDEAGNMTDLTNLYKFTPNGFDYLGYSQSEIEILQGTISPSFDKAIVLDNTDPSIQILDINDSNGNSVGSTDYLKDQDTFTVRFNVSDETQINRDLLELNVIDSRSLYGIDGYSSVASEGIEALSITIDWTNSTAGLDLGFNTSATGDTFIGATAISRYIESCTNSSSIISINENNGEGLVDTTINCTATTQTPLPAREFAQIVENALNSNPDLDNSYEVTFNANPNSMRFIIRSNTYRATYKVDENRETSGLKEIRIIAKDIANNSKEARPITQYPSDSNGKVIFDFEAPNIPTLNFAKGENPKPPLDAAQSNNSLLSENWYNYKKITIDWNESIDKPTSTDNSGILEYTFYFKNGGTTTQIETGTDTDGILELSDQDSGKTWELMIRVKDKAGNISSEESLFTYKFDYEAPAFTDDPIDIDTFFDIAENYIDKPGFYDANATYSGQPGDSTFISNTPTISFKTADDQETLGDGSSGMSHYLARIITPEAPFLEPAHKSKTISASAPLVSGYLALSFDTTGTDLINATEYTIEIFPVDKAGNIGASASINVIADTHAPPVGEIKAWITNIAEDGTTLQEQEELYKQLIDYPGLPGRKLLGTNKTSETSKAFVEFYATQELDGAGVKGYILRENNSTLETYVMSTKLSNSANNSNTITVDDIDVIKVGDTYLQTGTLRIGNDIITNFTASDSNAKTITLEDAITAAEKSRVILELEAHYRFSKPLNLGAKPEGKYDYFLGVIDEVDNGYHVLEEKYVSFTFSGEADTKLGFTSGEVLANNLFYEGTNEVIAEQVNFTNGSDKIIITESENAGNPVTIDLSGSYVPTAFAETLTATLNNSGNLSGTYQVTFTNNRFQLRRLSSKYSTPITWNNFEIDFRIDNQNLQPVDNNLAQKLGFAKEIYQGDYKYRSNNTVTTFSNIDGTLYIKELDGDNNFIAIPFAEYSTTTATATSIVLTLQEKLDTFSAERQLKGQYQIAYGEDSNDADNYQRFTIRRIVQASGILVDKTNPNPATMYLHVIENNGALDYTTDYKTTPVNAMQKAIMDYAQNRFASIKWRMPFNRPDPLVNGFSSGIKDWYIIRFSNTEIIDENVHMQATNGQEATSKTFQIEGTDLVIKQTNSNGNLTSEKRLDLEANCNITTESSCDWYRENKITIGGIEYYYGKYVDNTSPNASGIYTYNLKPNEFLDEGGHYFLVIARDKVGNFGPISDQGLNWGPGTADSVQLTGQIGINAFAPTTKLYEYKPYDQATHFLGPQIAIDDIYYLDQDVMIKVESPDKKATQMNTYISVTGIEPNFDENREMTEAFDPIDPGTPAKPMDYTDQGYTLQEKARARGVVLVRNGEVLLSNNIRTLAISNGTVTHSYEVRKVQVSPNANTKGQLTVVAEEPDSMAVSHNFPDGLEIITNSSGSGTGIWTIVRAEKEDGTVLTGTDLANLNFTIITSGGQNNAFYLGPIKFSGETLQNNIAQLRYFSTTSFPGVAKLRNLLIQHLVSAREIDLQLGADAKEMAKVELLTAMSEINSATAFDNYFKKSDLAPQGFEEYTPYEKNIIMSGDSSLRVKLNAIKNALAEIANDLSPSSGVEESTIDTNLYNLEVDILAMGEIYFDTGENSIYKRVIGNHELISTDWDWNKPVEKPGIQDRDSFYVNNSTGSYSFIATDKILMKPPNSTLEALSIPYLIISEDNDFDLVEINNSELPTNSSLANKLRGISSISSTALQAVGLGAASTIFEPTFHMIYVKPAAQESVKSATMTFGEIDVEFARNEGLDDEKLFDPHMYPVMHHDGVSNPYNIKPDHQMNARILASNPKGNVHYVQVHSSLEKEKGKFRINDSGLNKNDILCIYEGANFSTIKENRTDCSSPMLKVAIPQGEYNAEQLTINIETALNDASEMSRTYNVSFTDTIDNYGNTAYIFKISADDSAYIAWRTYNDYDNIAKVLNYYDDAYDISLAESISYRTPGTRTYETPEGTTTINLGNVSLNAFNTDSNSFPGLGEKWLQFSINHSSGGYPTKKVKEYIDPTINYRVTPNTLKEYSFRIDNLKPEKNDVIINSINTDIDLNGREDNTGVPFSIDYSLFNNYFQIWPETGSDSTSFAHENYSDNFETYQFNIPNVDNLKIGIIEQNADGSEGNIQYLQVPIPTDYMNQTGQISANDMAEILNAAFIANRNANYLPNLGLLQKTTLKNHYTAIAEEYEVDGVTGTGLKIYTGQPKDFTVRKGEKELIISGKVDMPKERGAIAKAKLYKVNPAEDKDPPYVLIGVNNSLEVSSTGYFFITFTEAQLFNIDDYELVNMTTMFELLARVEIVLEDLAGNISDPIYLNNVEYKKSDIEENIDTISNRFKMDFSTALQIKGLIYFEAITDFDYKHTGQTAITSSVSDNILSEQIIEITEESTDYNETDTTFLAKIAENTFIENRTKLVELIEKSINASTLRKHTYKVRIDANDKLIIEIYSPIADGREAYKIELKLRDNYGNKIHSVDHKMKVDTSLSGIEEIYTNQVAVGSGKFIISGTGEAMSSLGFTNTRMEQELNQGIKASNPFEQEGTISFEFYEYQYTDNVSGQVPLGCKYDEDNNTHEACEVTIDLARKEKEIGSDQAYKERIRLAIESKLNEEGKSRYLVEYHDDDETGEDKLYIISDMSARNPDKSDPIHNRQAIRFKNDLTADWVRFPEDRFDGADYCDNNNEYCLAEEINADGDITYFGYISSLAPTISLKGENKGQIEPIDLKIRPNYQVIYNINNLNNLSTYNFNPDLFDYLDADSSILFSMNSSLIDRLGQLTRQVAQFTPMIQTRITHLERNMNDPSFRSAIKSPDSIVASYRQTGEAIIRKGEREFFSIEVGNVAPTIASNISLIKSEFTFDPVDVFTTTKMQITTESSDLGLMMTSYENIIVGKTIDIDGTAAPSNSGERGFAIEFKFKDGQGMDSTETVTIEDNELNGVDSVSFSEIITEKVLSSDNLRELVPEFKARFIICRGDRPGQACMSEAGSPTFANMLLTTGSVKKVDAIFGGITLFDDEIDDSDNADWTDWGYTPRKLDSYAKDFSLNPFDDLAQIPNNETPPMDVGPNIFKDNGFRYLLSAIPAFDNINSRAKNGYMINNISYQVSTSLDELECIINDPYCESISYPLTGMNLNPFDEFSFLSQGQNGTILGEFINPQGIQFINTGFDDTKDISKTEKTLGGMYLSEILEIIRKNIAEITRDPTINPTLPPYIQIEKVTESNSTGAFDLADTNTNKASYLPAFDNENVYYIQNKNVVIGGTPLTSVGKDFHWTTIEGTVGDTNNTEMMNEKFVKTIIIEGGNLIIRSNLVYKSPQDNVGIIVLKSRNFYKSGGNIFIDPAVTNVQANFFVEGAIMPLDSANFDPTKTSSLNDALKIQNLNPGVYPVEDIHRTTVLNNQLVIHGVVTSLGNTVQGSTKNIPYNNAADNRTVDIAAHRLFTLNVYGEPISNGKRANIYNKYGINTTDINGTPGVNNLCYKRDWNKNGTFDIEPANLWTELQLGLDWNGDGSDPLQDDYFIEEIEFMRDSGHTGYITTDGTNNIGYATGGISGDDIPDQDQDKNPFNNCQGEGISPIIIIPDGRIVQSPPPAFKLPIEYKIERTVF
jgi:hypothetical protein